ncbi:MAG: ImmA/IrrE family metallo-endopeptidase [Pseudohongiella sp.]|uniref:ImmA/IrrE family metallo-endopeptidase n=1 Tax=Pseudohongiella sp. TaxID=1979412 RepID=UPI0034A05D7C
MDHAQIQARVKELHKELWESKELLWPDRSVQPIQMLEPWAAARILGVQYDQMPTLGNSRFTKYRVAGALDRQANKIAVSTEFAPTTVRFTGAHEIGHWELHSDHVMHRDRPVKGLTLEPRPAQEREADYFAACFLMPAQLLANYFSQFFQTSIPLSIEDTVAFHLDPNDYQSLTLADSGSLVRELAVARCRSFGGNHFNSLAQIFRVSDLAMALRLKELGFIRWP